MPRCRNLVVTQCHAGFTTLKGSVVGQDIVSSFFGWGGREKQGEDFWDPARARLCVRTTSMAALPFVPVMLLPVFPGSHDFNSPPARRGAARRKSCSPSHQRETRMTTIIINQAKERSRERRATRGRTVEEDACWRIQNQQHAGDASNGDAQAQHDHNEESPTY